MGLTLIFMWKWLNTALKAVASFSFNLSNSAADAAKIIDNR